MSVHNVDEVLWLTGRTPVAAAAWFVRRMNKFFQARGRTQVGWNDIIEGGATPGAVVISWRGARGAASKRRGTA